MSYADKVLKCRDCGAEFVFTAGEQEFYAQKGFINEPTRCPTCRRARKAAGGGGGGRSRDSYGGGGYGDRDSYSSGDSYGSDSYSSGDSYGGGYSSGGRGGYGDRDSGYSSDRGGRGGFGGAREMHTAVCASCGGEAKVPFVPRGDKPVYCSNCFQEQRRSSGGGRGGW